MSSQEKEWLLWTALVLLGLLVFQIAVSPNSPVDCQTQICEEQGTWSP